jgi:hypothetical protein
VSRIECSNFSHTEMLVAIRFEAPVFAPLATFPRSCRCYWKTPNANHGNSRPGGSNEEGQPLLAVGGDGTAQEDEIKIPALEVNYSYP